MLAVSSILAARPDLVHGARGRLPALELPQSPRVRVGVSTRTPPSLIGLLVSAVLAGVASFYASGRPDGLEHVAATLGFGSTARDSAAAGSPAGRLRRRGGR